MVNTPIPHSLRSEAKKAAKILREFSMPNAKTGPDKLIPAGILAKAKGLAIITVFKAGFLVTARGGSGVVIAKLDDDPIDFASGWSAPSAIGLAGLGGGFEIGAEVTDFVIILNTRSAVDAFSKGGNLTLGGNFTIAAGPLGRNVEGDIAVRSPAAIYTYSKTKGIFAGISVEGSALIERKDANRKFYGKEIRAHQILSGQVDPPDDCRALYEVMREHQEFALKAAANMVKDKVVEKSSSRTSRFSFSRSRSTKSNLSSSSRSKSEWYLPRDPSPSASSEPGRKESRDDSSYTERSTRIVNAVNLSDTKDPWDKYDRWKASAASAQASFHRREYDSDDDDDAVWAVADFPFQGELGCDLSFRAGDRIKVVTRTRNQQDWWEGLDSSGHQGIFPANFVHVVS